MHTLEDLNTASVMNFVAALDGICEHAPWVAEAIAAQRPFATVTALHDALMAAVRNAGTDRLAGFLRSHPPLSPKALSDPALTVASRSEQGGLAMASLGSALERFEAASAVYEQRFDFPFIVCVRRLTPSFVLGALEQRLANSREQELAVTLAEISYITRLRLVDRVRGAGMPQTSGHLSTHVLDTARGKAAMGIQIAVLREDILVHEAVTNADGRTDTPLLHGEPLRVGRYELRFKVGDYYANWPDMTDPPWYDVIPVRFGVSEPEGRYHIPLLLGTWSYTTYRGT